MTMVEELMIQTPPSSPAPPVRTVARRSRTQSLPLVPMGEAVVFPTMELSIQINSPRSLRALDAALRDRRRVVLAARRVEEEDGESVEGLVSVGCLALVQDVQALPGGGQRVSIQGVKRVSVRKVTQEDPYFRVDAVELPDKLPKRAAMPELMARVISQIDTYVSLVPGIPNEVGNFVRGIDDPSRLADMSAYSPDYTFQERQELLETQDVAERLKKVSGFMSRLIELASIRQKVQEEVHAGVEKGQREFFLREQIKVLRKELGENDPETALLDEFREKIDQGRMPEAVKTKALHEVERLQLQGPHSPESGMIRAYLDWLVELPWGVFTEDNLDLDQAARILNEDHYGLEKVKERILEYIAVRKLAGDRMRSPILCFVGPPGVGKTSLGRSIARALGRQSVRISLGGVRDEAEIRGHRRTYVGALPGRVLRGMRDAKSSNPIFILDEIDKVGTDFRGDPSSALLEVLDPEQNHAFSDHYLEVAFDLSKTIFVTTANLLDPIPPALQDRMEVIELPGYTDEEKVRIAQDFLLPKQREAHGLAADQLLLDDAALHALVHEYTREAGVRNLERELANLCRKVARRVAAVSDNAVSPPASWRLSAAELPDYLGPRRFMHGLAEERDEIGVATGVAVTQAGGDVMAVEVSLMPGTGKLTLTGQLGNVMQESAQAAVSYARGRSADWKLADGFFDQHNIHIHVPAGAVPKDGPSAGTAMATALISTLVKRAVRRDVAMTGEITLRGKILAIGGLKEKALAVDRAGIATFLYPRDNEKDLPDVPEKVRQHLRLLPMDHLDDVLRIGLV
ncbi:MAG TPA: endopeptidase La, partial [Chloroflexota bacterium]|nr:endopeptidase La [Chloroflexota bacterium]